MKKSSYQKLKEENAQFKQDIYKLVMQPDSFKALRVKAQYEIKFGMADIILSGSRDTNVNESIEGLINMPVMIIPYPTNKFKPFWQQLNK